MGILANRRRELFAQGLAKGQLSRDAYTAAGYVPNEGNATRLAMEPDVRARVDEIRSMAALRVEITVSRVLDEMGRIAFFDPRLLFNPDGSLKPMDQWPADAAQAVAAVECDEVQRKGKLSVSVRKVRFWDKPKGLEMLARTLSMFKDKLEINRPTDDMTDEQLAAYIAQLRSQLGQQGAGAAGTGAGEADGAKPPGDIPAIH